MNSHAFGRTGSFLVLLLSLLAGPSPAQTAKEPPLTAELSISPSRLTPGSTIEVVFPTAMVDAAMTGQKAEASPLVIEPELAGEFEWTSSRSGNYRLTQTPRFNQKYAFRLRAGLTDQAGQALDTAVIDTVSSDGFKVLDQDPKWYGQNDVPRSRPFVFQFNDAVLPAEATPHLSYRSTDPEQVIPARARHATGKDLRDLYADLQRTWAEETSGAEPVTADDEPRLSALIVEPAEPLPAAKQWDLVLAPELANSAGQARLGEERRVRIGSVLPMLIESVSARTPFDKDYHLDIDFNKTLKTPAAQEGEDAAAQATRRATWSAELMARVVVEPAPADLRAEVNWDVLRLTGSFQLGTEYRVTVPPGFESWDGLQLEQPFTQTVTFEPNPPYVSAPAFVSSQMARGETTFEISAANVRAVRVRAKRLNGPQLVEAREKIRPYLAAFEPTLDKRRAHKPVPIEDYPGDWALDREFKIDKPLDRSELIALNLRELLPAGADGGALLLEMEGFAQDGLKDRGVLTQSLVETTNLGLMLKASGKDQLVFVTRLHDAAPVANARVTLLDSERKLLGHSETGADGVARVTSATPVYVLAELGNDSVVIDTQRDSELWSVYGYEINRTWSDPWEPERRTFIFSDRSLYRPGDTLYLKALTRQLVGDSLTLDGREQTARLRLRDARYRLIHDEPVTFNANGSLTTQLTLPAGPLGGYNVEINFADDNNEEGGDGAYHWFRVDDYRPNTFEVSLDPAAAVLGDEQLQVPLTARYYMGKPLSQAEIQWHAFNSPGFERPAEFADYHFGDAPAWAGYNSVRTSYYEEESSDWFVSGDLPLSPDGTALLPLPKPPPHRSAFPQIIEVTAEVTDLNQQTITSRASVRVPGAQLLPGIRPADGFGLAGKEVALSLVAIQDNGKPAPGSVTAEVLIERQEYQVTKVETAGGGTDTETTVVLHEERRENVTLEQGKATLSFTPAQGGSYFITLTTEDAAGTRAFSRLPFYVIGRGGYPWRIERGVRLTLQPEKKTVAPGGEAVINIQCPIEGTALVTVERNRIHQHFVRPYKLDDPVLRIPVGEADAPNIFVSVVVVRGAAASGKKQALPEFRAGYVEIEVPSDALALKVGISPDQAEVLPGSELGVSVRVTDARGAPLPGADVALFAVDEGVLSLTQHQTPDPDDFFHRLFPLAFANHTSLENLLAEEPGLRVRSNKGFLVGGGGDDEVIADAMRKNFVATPLWLGSALTDGNGVVRATVPVPDNLTRYRLMSVVSAGAERFGSGESAFTVNKPLMLEPVVPRFARLGDEVLVKALLHNTTAQGREVELSLTLDDGAALITEARPFSPASDATETRQRQIKVAVPAGASVATAFPVRFEALGETVWTWRATTLGDADKLSDATESRFQVEHPVPELREVHYARVSASPPAAPEKKAAAPASPKTKAAKTKTPAKAAPKEPPPGPLNLLAKVKPAVLETEGAVKISLTTSRLSELDNALDYLLQYPYGCVEQTTSSTLPWLALGGYHSLFPGKLDPTKARDAIQHGASRLLQMVVEGEGGLAYWPGGSEPSRWGSAYGGLLLLRARDAGAQVPASVIDALCEYLSKNLRGLDTETDPYVVSDAALSLYTLAKAKRAEPAYHTLLYERRARLPEPAKLYLGLAMLLADAPHDQVKTLLGYGPAEKSDPKAQAASFSHWAGTGVNQALRLLACTHMGLNQNADALATAIWNARNLNGEWGNTYTNAWTLTALAAYDRSRKTPSGAPFEATLAWGGEKQRLTLGGDTPLAELRLPLSLDRAASPLTLDLPEGAAAWVKTEVAGRPRARDFAGENHGYSIARDYRKVLPDGSTEPAENLRVGDLVQVSLGIELGGNDRYLAIEDPLPSVFEPMNPDYESQNARQDGPFDDYEPWFCDHRELRADRALFFTDHAPERGKFVLHYLARVIAEGDTIAPPAKIEAMYEPSKYGLSPTQRVTTLPNAAGKVAER